MGKKLVDIAITLYFVMPLGGQEFRASVNIQNAQQQLSLDLANVSDLSGVTLTIHNSSSQVINWPQITNVNAAPPLNPPSILGYLSLLGATNDQDNVINAWRFVSDRIWHFCGAGFNIATYDAISLLNGYGFGCCDQAAETLAWVWGLQGYPTRVAWMLNFHDVPEVFYANAWHMLDPDHKVYYLKDDGSIASVADLIANPTLVSRVADSNGNDPAGVPAAEMAALYAQAGPTLVYSSSIPPSNLSTINLHPHESLTWHSENMESTALYYFEGVAMPNTSVSSAEFEWNISYSDPSWTSFVYASGGVSVVTDATGMSWLTNSSSSPGYVIYQEFSPFPVMSLSVLAQVNATNGGSLIAYFSTDGVNWSDPVPFLSAMGESSFDWEADLSNDAAGSSSYFIKIVLEGNIKLHRLRIHPAVQTSRLLFPQLTPGAFNQLLYQDLSPAQQNRSITVTVTVPGTSPMIRGLRATSLVPEDPVYSLGCDYEAANLVDGDPDTLAYPASTHLDYKMQLPGQYQVSGISINWGYFGTQPEYVTSWQVLASSDDTNWQVAAAGGFPNSAVLDVPLNVSAKELRLVADSPNWIGIYEVQVFGKFLPPPLPIGTFTAKSNVPEDPIYSIAAQYGAQNLVDGNSNTLAYPASKSIDYEISAQAPAHIYSADITWGYFGTSPIYINTWTLLGKNDSGWLNLGQGGFPNSNTTHLDFDFTGTDLRLVASSDFNWIGAYEVRLNGAVPLSGLSASANVPEFTTGPQCGPASNLVDGDESTAACPCSTSPDYTIDLGQQTYVDSVKIVWGSSGTDPSLIQDWRLLGQTLDGSWNVIARGSTPNATESEIMVQDRYRRIRISVDGSASTGIDEIYIMGAAAPIDGQQSVFSNVPEDPTYSLAEGLQASNLMDGDTTTLAYPASRHIDYQISFGAPRQLSQAVIDWGEFGIDPQYVQSWSLLGRNGSSSPWLTLSEGGFPSSAVTEIPLQNTVTDVRIVADSNNWIGIYELDFETVPGQ